MRRGLRTSSAWAPFVAAIALEGCARDADPLPQLVVVVDTDAVVVGQLVAHEELSAASAIDSVRVDVLDEHGRQLDAREIVAADPRDWPLSFGVAGSDRSSTVRLRIRAFRAATAHVEAADVGSGLLVPQPTLSIDRVVDLAVPTAGVVTARVSLSFACFGVGPSFVPPATTCVDEARKHVAPTTGIGFGATDATSHVGTTTLAREVPCTTTKDGALCIPGGFSVLGDVLGVTLVGGDLLAATPPRAVRLSPFLMDRREFTVGRYRALMKAGLVGDPRPTPLPTPAEYCTWISATDATNDDYPLNCVGADVATKACAADGGALPTEAQWEHAARGRGRGWSFPWANVPARCCAASISRDPFGFNQCSPVGLELGGSHPPSDACDGIGDRSLDGIDDLAGSLNELVLDRAHPFSHPCWEKDGIGLDPRCDDAKASAFVTRGNDWATGSAITVATYRRRWVVAPNGGFRCVYPGVAP